MSRRRAVVELGGILDALRARSGAGAAPRAPAGDDDGARFDGRVLDAAEDLLRSAGLRRWSVEDVALRAGVGRTSVYRSFGGRDQLVHAVLARELRATLDAIAVAAATAPAPGLEDKVVAAVAAAFGALDGSVVESLLRSDPATFLPFLTTDAGPLLAIAREAIAVQVAAATGRRPPPELAEAAARFGLSFVLTRDTVLPVGDPDALAAAVRRVVRPLGEAMVLDVEPDVEPDVDVSVG